MTEAKTEAEAWMNLTHAEVKAGLVPTVDEQTPEPT